MRCPDCKGNHAPDADCPPIDALYRCMRCFHEWQGKAGPVVCPECGHLYVKWLDYEDK